MKILTSIVLAMFALAFMAPMVLAEDAIVAESTDLEEPGITPDSPLYGLDRAIERIGLALTFDKAKRSEKALRNAEERLAEVKAMVEANKLEHAERAQERHAEMLERAEEAAEEIEADGDEETAKDAEQKIAEIRARLREHVEKVAAVKARILARQRERMSEDQIAKIEQVFGEINANAEDMEARVLQRQETIRTRYKVLSGQTDEEVEDELGEIEDEDSEEEEDESEEEGQSSEIASQAQTQSGQADETEEE